MRRPALLVTVGMLAASTALLWGGSATAAPVGRNGGSSADARSAHQRIVDYWTPARRASAIPRDVTRPSERKGKPGGGGGGGTSSTVTGATWTRTGAAVEKTTGKVYFTMGGSNYVCSGSAVAGPVNLVLSAGHCVWDDADSFATNWMFCAGLQQRQQAVRQIGPPPACSPRAGWKAAGGNDWKNDAGMAVVTGGDPGHAWSELGPAADDEHHHELLQPAGAVYSAFGYPAAQKYKGADPDLLPGLRADRLRQGPEHPVHGLRHDRRLLGRALVRRSRRRRVDRVAEQLRVQRRQPDVRTDLRRRRGQHARAPRRTVTCTPATESCVSY